MYSHICDFAKNTDNIVSYDIFYSTPKITVCYLKIEFNEFDLSTQCEFKHNIKTNKMLDKTSKELIEEHFIAEENAFISHMLKNKDALRNLQNEIFKLKKKHADTVEVSSYRCCCYLIT